MNRWLVKTDPDAYAFDDLVREGTTRWEGVRNATARIHLRAMRTGDGVLVYETGGVKAVVGLATVAKGAYPEPGSKDRNAVVVDLKSDEGLAADIGSLTVETRENLSDVVAGMGELRGAGAPGGDSGADLGAPAGTTTIPDGFPLSPDLLPRGPVPIEAHIADLCDKIAYLSHDLDDGLRAGLFTEDEAGELRLWQQARQSAGTANRQRVVSDVTALLIHDLVESGDAAIAAAPAGGPAPRLQHSAAMAVLAQEVLEFLRVRFYRSPRVLAVMHDGASRIRRLFKELRANPVLLPESAQRRMQNDGPERAICDYIAGMTDRFLHRATEA